MPEERWPGVVLPEIKPDEFGIIGRGTAHVYSSTIILTPTDIDLTGCIIVTGTGQSRQIVAWDASTHTATVDAWTTPPSGVVTYNVFGVPTPPWLTIKK